MALMINNDKRKLNGKINTLMQKKISISKRIIIKRKKEKSNQRKKKKKNQFKFGGSLKFISVSSLCGWYSRYGFNL